MQYIWRPFSKHFDDSNEIFTHTFINRYVWPDGFNFDSRKGRDYINENNAERKA